MHFEIDISGEDLLSKNYTICVSNEDSLIKGFKINEDLLRVLSSRYGQGIYRYNKSKKGKSDLKVRIYSVIIYYLIKSMNLQGEISLSICRDFQGREEDIRKNLKFFLGEVLKLDIGEKIFFEKLSRESNAHKYAYLMRNDNKNKMNTYVKISIEEIEKWLKK